MFVHISNPWQMTSLEHRILELCSLALAYPDKKEFEDILAQLKAVLIEHEAAKNEQPQARYPKSA